MGIFSFFKKDKQQGQPKQQTIRQEQKQPEAISVPGMIDGQKCAYQYTKVPVALASGINLESVFAQRIQFDLSRGNVALIVNNQFIGTIGNAKLSEMVSDWLRRGEPVFAVLTSYDDEKYTAAFDLYLYRDELKYLLRRYPDAKRYKLAGNRRGDMQDHICHCERGEECEIEYDYDKEKYLVSAGFEIGYLPAAAAKVVEEQGESNVAVYVAEVGSDDEGIDEVAVYLFPKR